MSQLYSASLPEMLSDDISPAALWEALESNPSALRAAHAAETHAAATGALSVIEDVQSQRQLEGMYTC